MLTKRFLSAWFYVKLDSTSHRRKWHPIVIKAGMMVGIRGDTFDWRNRFKIIA
jgi:hypothetical protein